MTALYIDSRSIRPCLARTASVTSTSIISVAWVPPSVSAWGERKTSNSRLTLSGVVKGSRKLAALPWAACSRWGAHSEAARRGHSSRMVRPSATSAGLSIRAR